MKKDKTGVVRMRNQKMYKNNPPIVIYQSAMNLMSLLKGNHDALIFSPTLSSREVIRVDALHPMPLIRSEVVASGIREHQGFRRVCTVWVSMPSIIHYQTIHVKIPLELSKSRHPEGVVIGSPYSNRSPRSRVLYDPIFF